jgi:EAL domain-containing protein (putative c-di-GMP-specific phosphodiesterase class I)
MIREMPQAIAQGNGTEHCGIFFGPAFLVRPACETVEEIKHLLSDRPLRVGRRLTILEAEALEDEIDLKDALKSLKEPGSISLNDFKKNLDL